MDVWYDGSHAMSFYKYGTSDNPIGDLVGHTWKSWGLIPTSRPLVAPPTPKTSTIDLQGADGVIDASESLTKWPLYNNRTGSWKFFVTDYNDHDDFILDNEEKTILDHENEPIKSTVISNWSSMYSKLLNLLHGKIMVVVLDDDPDYYYKGRFRISEWVSSNDGSLSGLTLEYDVFPYKLKKTNSGIWIREANPSVEIIGGRQPLIPYIYTMGAYKDDTKQDRIKDKTIKLSFTNPELGINLSNVEYSNYLAQYIRMEDIGGNADFIVTNLSGQNKCVLTVSDITNCEYVYLKFRVGDL